MHAETHSLLPPLLVPTPRATLTHRSTPSPLPPRRPTAPPSILTPYTHTPPSILTPYTHTPYTRTDCEENTLATAIMETEGMEEVATMLLARGDFVEFVTMMKAKRREGLAKAVGALAGEPTFGGGGGRGSGGGDGGGSGGGDGGVDGGGDGDGGGRGK